MSTRPPTPTPSPTAPGEDQSLALAFVNTRRRRGRRTVDTIASPQALCEWLAARDLETRAISDTDLDRIHALRDAVRALLHAATHDVPPPNRALETVNRASATAPRALALSWRAGEPPSRDHLTTAGDPLTRAQAAIAIDTIELLTDERGRGLAECEGPGCVRFLLKDHPRRHWCSAGCGERARAARYYRRHH